MPEQPNQGSSSSVSYSAANSITSATTQSGQTYTSSTADENAVLISTSGNVTITNPTVTKSGDSDGGDNCNFYGINSAVMALGGGTTSITGGTVTATAKGANGIFSYGGNGGTNGAAGDGTTVYISGTTINTSGDNGGGIMTTGGGNTVAKNLTITTTGNSSAPIRTDRGGGSVTVSGGSYTSSGLGSPAIYSTADITVENATLVSKKSEGVCIEGQNSVALTNCTLTASNTQTNGNAQFLDAVILYQSQSGDAASGTASFTMTNGTINNQSGHIFHVTNTSAVINLSNVTINDSGAGVLLSVCDDGWSGASNIATINASEQTLDGDILVGDDSTLTLNLTNGTTFTGAISGSITNNAGTTVSSDVGTVNVSLDSTSKWYLEEDTYISSFSGTAANVITSGYTLYVNGNELDGTTETEETDTSTGLVITNTASGTVITGSAYGDTITNSGSRVTINALAGDDSIDNLYQSGGLINGGAGNDSIYNGGSYVSVQGDAGDDRIRNGGDNSTVNAGAGDDSIYNSGDNSSIDGGAGADTLTNGERLARGGSYVTMSGGDGADYLSNNGASNVTMSGGAGNDSIYSGRVNAMGDTVYPANVSMSGGAGNDYISSTGRNPATVTGGTGDDTISLNSSATGNVIQYASGDGNDSISGFNATSTLSITGAAYTSVTSGDDLIIGVGTGSISLIGAVNLSTVNIIGTLSGGSSDTQDGGTLQGTSGDDSLEIIHDERSWTGGVRQTIYSALYGLGGNDTLINGDFIYETGERKNNVIMDGGAGNDYINSYGKNSTLIGGAGNDTIYNRDEGSNVIISGGAGNDYIDNEGDNVSISAGDGDNYIHNEGSNVTLDALGSGNDTVSNYSDGLTIDMGAGNNRVYNAGDNLSITAGAGADTIRNDGSNVMISAGAGNNSIETGGEYVTINTGAGNDTIEGSADNASINSGAGNDSIENMGDIVLIDGGAGNDAIRNYGDNSTINAGTGNDTINNIAENVLFIYNAGDGNDYITGRNGIGFDADDTLSITGSTYTSVTSGDDLIIGVGTGSITLAGAANLSTVNIIGTLSGGSTSADTAVSISNRLSNTLITGTAYNDTLSNYGGSVTIQALAGDDTIYNSGWDELDTINDGSKVLIVAGAGNDSVRNRYGDSVTIDGGEGNNYINNENSSNVSISTGAGNDTLYVGYGGHNTANAGAGNNIIFSYATDSSITAGAGNDSIYYSGGATTIRAGAGNDTFNAGNNDGYNMYLDGGAGNDSIKAPAGGTVLGGAGNDTINSFVYNNLINPGAGNDVISLSSSNDTITYAAGDGNDIIYGIGDAVSAVGLHHLSIGGATYTSVKSGNDLILGVGTGSITLDGAASLSTVNIIGTLDGGSTPADTGVDITNTTSNTVITGTAYADTITNRASNVTINALGGNDIITNNYTTSPDNVSINGGAGNDSIENAGDNSTVQGGAGNDSISNILNTGAILDGGAGNDTIENYGDSASISGGAGNDFLGNYRKGSTVLGGDGADTIENAGDNSTVQGGAGNDSISNVMSMGAILDGGAGNDTIENYGDNASINGGAGNDTIIIDGDNNLVNYADGDGNDLIQGFRANSTISIGGAAYSSVQSDDDIILTIGDGNVTLTDAASLEMLNIIGTLDGGGEGTSINNTVSNTLITGTPYADSIRNTGANVTIQALTGNDTITSNGDRSSISALGGNDLITFTGQNVTINAGTGNDTLRRSAFGSGKALIEYKAGDGNDYIANLNANDTLSIAGAAYSSIESDDDMILVVEDNFITLRGAADRNINIIGEYTDSVKPGEYIINRLSNTTLTGTPLADTISNYGNYVTIQALASQDSLRNYGNRVSISGGTGDDYIDNYSSLVTIEGDSGNDTINNISGNYVTVWTGAGNDSVNNGGNYVTIRADAGDDTIINSGDNVVFVCYARNGGNDLIQGFKANSTLSIVADVYDSGSFTSVQSGNDIVLTFISGGNTVTLQGAATLSTVNIFGGGEVGISVNNTVNNTLITGTDYADTLTNSGNYVTINAGKDNDTIYSSGDNSVIDAGTGNDTVRNGGDNTSIFGGAGNDSIMSDGGGMTITGGKGDDTINSSRFGGVGTTYRYTSGDGNDFIQNFENEDTLVVIGSDFTTTRANDAVVVVTVGEGQITLLGAMDTPNIIKESGGGLEIHNTTNGTLITGSDYNDTITNTGTRVTVQALSGDDYIANVVDSSVTTASLGNSISAGDGNDTIYNYHTYNPTLLGGNGDDSIVVTNGHLTYIDGGAGNDTILGLSESIHSDDWAMGGHATIRGGAGNDYIAPFYSNDSSINGGTGNDTIIINGANTTIDGGAGNNLIRLTTDEEGATAQYIVMNGKTTVESFGTGFGDVSDTVYVDFAPNVDFKSGGLTFYSSDKSVKLDGVTSTAKVNLYIEAEDKLAHGVYIADDAWYKVTDLELRATNNLYYVGATASKNHGLNFGAVTGSLNMTLDTDYAADTNFYVNNVYSIRGGAGNTTITGSKRSDTIIAGTGSTTINAGAGGDILSGNGKTTFNIDGGATATVNGTAGDSLNVANDNLIFGTDGTAYIVNGTLRSVSDNTLLESAHGDLIRGGRFEHATIVNGESVSLTADDKEIFIGKRGASLKGYTLDKAFIRNERDAATLFDLINATDASQLVLDAGIFYAEGQKPVVLEDYDTSRGTFVNIKTADGRKNIFGWSPLNGGIVDGNDIDKAQILFGDAPNGNSTIRGGIANDTLYAGARDVVSLSGGHDDLYINDETSHGVTVDLGDGSAQSRTKIIDGFDVTRDLLKIDSPENINARVLDGSLQFIKGDSRVTFEELATFDDANGLTVQIDGTTYELRNDYDSGLKGVDYLWTDTDGNYYLTDSTFRIHDDGATREYFIAEGSGRLTIDGFNFGRDNDKLNLTTIDGLNAYGDNLYISSGDSDVVEIVGGAGKTLDVKLDGTIYTAQLGKHLTYDLTAEYYGDIHGGTGNAISVAANFAQEEVAIYLNEEEEADGKIRYYGGVTKIDASAFTGQASLVGSEFNDKIIAARGATSLWGGESGDDELFGTGTDNSFFYCKGDGDDKIYNAADGDAVNLVDITLEDIVNSNIAAEAVTLELSDGGRLTVMNSADVTFNLGDGTSWKADRQAREWQQQA